MIEPDEANNRNEQRKRPHEPLKTEFIQFTGLDGTPIRKSANLGQNALVINTGEKHVTFINTSVGGLDVRQIQRPLQSRSGETHGWLIVARPVTDAIVVLGDLHRVLLLSFPAILITLFALTRSIAARSIKPVKEVIDTAEGITKKNLDQRIRLPENRDELYRLSATINALLDRLQDAFNRETQFTADASHELKTPLAAVKGTLEVLIRKPRTQEHYEDRIGLCLNELNRMAQLIEQLLLLARHEKSTMTPKLEPLELNISINEVVKRLKALAEPKGITLDFSKQAAGIVEADPEMLGMIIENVLSNAVKYSPTGSTVTVDTGISPNATRRTITDQGMGIPEQQLHSIFERFYRMGESRSASSGGSGLGLAIVKKLADLQGILISVESHPGDGTSFTLRFPRSSLTQTVNA